MCNLRELYYSPLCDVSEQAYGSYIEACDRHFKVFFDHGRYVGTSNLGVDVTKHLVWEGVTSCVGSADVRSFLCDVDKADTAKVGNRCDGCVFDSGDSSGTFGNVGGSVAGVVAECDGVSAVVGGYEDTAVGIDAALPGAQASGVGEARPDRYVPPAKRGPKGGVSVGRGPNYEKNQLARQRKKEASRLFSNRQAVRMPTFDACEQSVRDELQRTRANRLVVENKLRTVKMEQELEVVKSRDVQQMIQQQRTQLLRQTELNKVQIEKAHGSLSGEVVGSVPVVPTVVGGTIETILTSGSISPSSSISEAEIRKLHKDYLDGQAEIEKLKKDNYKLRFGVHQEDDEGRPDDSAPWDGGEDSVSQDQFSYRSGYMCTPEQREANKKLALELRGW